MLKISVLKVEGGTSHENRLWKIKSLTVTEAEKFESGEILLL